MRKVPFIRNEDIETAALILLAAYGRQYGAVSAPPVPVDGILESHLGLSLDFDDLPRRLGLRDALGATWMQARRVVVDQSLDPSRDASREGRYRFTVGHETGHWVLHRGFFLEAAGQQSLFGDEAKPSIVCRTGSRKDPMEWQADAFAGFLLMPKEFVFHAWEKHTGGRAPYVAEDEIKGLSEKWWLGEDTQPTVEIARMMARDFAVSGQAMQIRLIGLGLVRTEQPEPDLFKG